MKLYEVDSEILRLLCLLEPDPETGEIPENEEQLLTELNGLQMEREHILEYLAKVVLNTRAEQEMLKIEEARLYERRKKLEAKEDRLMRVLDRECDGKNTNLGIATFRYRATTKIEVADRAKAVNWLRRHKYEAGIDPLIAMKIIGHSDYQTTANVYTHIRDDMLKKSTVNMADVFRRIEQ